MAKRKSQIQQAEIVQRFAARLRELRASRGFTQAEMARAARVTASYVWRLESGAVAPGIDLVARLAKALGTTVHDLLPDEAGDDVPLLKERATTLFGSLIGQADRETLLLLCPLLSRIGESPTRRR